MMQIIRFFCLLNIQENPYNVWLKNFVPLHHKKIKLKTSE